MAVEQFMVSYGIGLLRGFDSAIVQHGVVAGHYALEAGISWQRVDCVVGNEIRQVVITVATGEIVVNSV